MIIVNRGQVIPLSYQLSVFGCLMPTEGSGAAVPSYVLSGHDFRRDSAKLMQASLALAAPKIQGSKFKCATAHSRLPTEGSKLQVPSSNAAELLVQGSNALKRVKY